MTYKEIKRRLSKCEKTLELFKKKDFKVATADERQQAQKDMKLLNERITKYKALLLKEEKTYILTPKSGKPSAASLGDDEVDALKDADDIKSIKGADGEEVKERLDKNKGVEFSLDETKAIAKKVGKAVAKSLKAVGDSITTMKAHRLEPNSFDIHVEYKNGRDDEFSFYISDDTLHLVDFSFDKELVDVGVKPSGEAIVHVDHLANELQKHFKSLSEDVNEVTYNHYTTPKHFDICPGAEALRDKLIDGGKSPEELGEWTYRHDQLFKIEKDVLKSKYANIKHVNAAEKLRAEIIHLSRDLGIDADDVTYLKGHVDKIQDVRMDVSNEEVNDKDTKDLKKLSKALKGSSQAHLDQKKKLDKLINTEGEGDDHHYIKVSRRDYKKAMSILDNNIDPTYVKTEVVDDDGAGNVVIYFVFRHEYGFDDMYDDPEGKENPELYQEPDEDPSGFMYDVVMDLQAQDIEVVDHSADMDEAVDINDPVLMRARVAKMRANDMKKLDALKKSDKRNAPVRAIIAKLKAKRAEVEREMENDPGIEPEGGPVADKYGDMLNKIDNAIEKAASKLVREEDDDYETDYVKRRKEDDDYYEDPDYYKEGVSEGTDLYDRNGIQITRFSGGERGLMVQINYGGKYIHVPADEFPILARAMQSVQGDLKDLTLQMPRKNYPKGMREGRKDNDALFPDNPRLPEIKKLADKIVSMVKAEAANGELGYINTMEEIRYQQEDDFERTPEWNKAKGIRADFNEGVAKIQKAHGLVVAKMKELAKQYKAGDTSVVAQLKDLTAKKKALELSLDKAVAGTNKGQELTEVSEDEVQDAIYELRNLIDEIDQKADEAREIVRATFPNELSRLDAYGAFNAMNSANRYDVTLGGFVDRLEEEGYEIDDEGNVETLEGKYKSDAQRKAIYATKAEKGELNEYTDDTFGGAELIKDVSKDSPDMFGKQLFADLMPKGVASEDEAVKALHTHDKSRIKQRMGGRLAPMFVHVQYHDLEHEGDKYRLHNRQYYNSNFKDKDPDFNPAVSKITLIKVVKDGDAKRGHDKTENLGSILVKTDAYVQDVRDLESQGKLGDRHMEEVLKEGATCCGRCGRVHVKGSGCKRPYLKGKSHCRNK